MPVGRVPIKQPLEAESPLLPKEDPAAHGRQRDVQVVVRRPLVVPLLQAAAVVPPDGVSGVPAVQQEAGKARLALHVKKMGAPDAHPAEHDILGAQGLIEVGIAPKGRDHAAPGLDSPDAAGDRDQGVEGGLRDRLVHLVEIAFGEPTSSDQALDE